uniref:Uncharacterized protein n=1 Tax=Glossina palpalis gambiensis TaxID=67801 RepID=A0A1B0BAP7_9MUSC
MYKNEALSFNARQGLCFCSCVFEFIDEGRKGIKNFHTLIASMTYMPISLSSQSTDCSTNLSNSLESPELLLRLRRLRCKFHLRFN